MSCAEAALTDRSSRRLYAYTTTSSSEAFCSALSLWRRLGFGEKAKRFRGYGQILHTQRLRIGVAFEQQRVVRVTVERV